MTSAEFGGVTRPARFPTTRPAHARRGRRRSVAATTCSRRGARSPSPCRLESRRGGWQSSRTAAGRGDVGGIRRGHETRAFSDDETGARTTRSAALGRSNDVLAARRSLAVAVSAQRAGAVAGRAAERPQGAVTSAEFGGVTRPARFPTTRPAHARRGRRRSVAATTCSRRGARSPSPCRLKRAGAVAGRAAERPQGAVTSAEFGGVTRPARFPTTRPAHARRGRRRSVAATTCSRRGARSPSPCRLKRAGAVAGRAAERPQGAVTSAEFGGVTRPARFPTTRPAHARRGRRRSVAATTCSRRGARSPSPCRLREPARWLAEQQNGRRAR